jgi:hypothetical protein
VDFELIEGLPKVAFVLRKSFDGVLVAVRSKDFLRTKATLGRPSISSKSTFF